MAGIASIAPLVLFDLDGTLVDSAPDLELAMNRYLAEQSLPAVESLAFRRTVSQGGRAMLRLSFADEDDDALGLRLPRFLSIYADSIAERSGLFDGMREVLDAIHAAGSRWGIVSNKPFALAEKLVSALGLDGECAVLLGGDSLPTRKPDPEPLRVACERVGVRVQDAVYVGDDRRDIDAARAAPMPSLAAAWGYRLVGDDIIAWGADHIVSQPLDLLRDGRLAVAAADFASESQVSAVIPAKAGTR
ncbi:MAG: phosphoglycolate phosphatase [Lysobacteraceae bacterium]